LNRPIKQKVSIKNIHPASGHHPIGDRRTSEDQRPERTGSDDAPGNLTDDSSRGNPDARSQSYRQELPYLSDYLARLGGQEKHQPKRLLGVFAKHSDAIADNPEAGAAPHLRDRHHIANERKNIEQRREPRGGAVAGNPPTDTLQVNSLTLSPLPLHELPYWSAYLSRLGGQVKQAAKPKTWPRVFIEQRKAKSWRQLFFTQRKAKIPHDNLRQDLVAASASAEQGRHPIGDRRVHNSSRRGVEANKIPVPYSLRVADLVEKSLYSRVGLRIWSYYFLAKLGLFWKELIAFHLLGNLAFALFILIPVTSYCRVKNVITVVLAFALLYYDSWLPPVGRLMSQASLLSNFSFAYLFELLGRFISWPVIGMLFAFMAVCFILSRWVRIDAVAIASMAIVGVFQILPLGHDVEQVMPDMDNVMQDFFARESKRSVLFVTPQADAVPFDVIFLHVCSLSWDDVHAVGLEEHPLWKRFDILLTKFNSAASYSGPGAIHLLRAKCGQQKHGEMYLPAAEKCYLMNSLQRSGFVTDVALNHDGKFDDFLGQLKEHGRLTPAPLALGGLEVTQYAFDKSPVYDDLAVLGRWLETRQTSNSSRVALYYNTVSMHDGNHLPGTHTSLDSLATYRTNLAKFLDETESFLQKLDASGRRAIVVMVPEHGGAVRGDKMQIAGLREIPTPSIALVPVGIKVIGDNIQREGEALLIDKPTSYLAISHIVERMLEQSPFNNNSFAPSDYVVDLPVTPFVAQNETTTVAEYDDQYYLKRGAAKWEAYTEFNKSAEK
jgi:cellulose synthase operon protein YhjU